MAACAVGLHNLAGAEAPWREITWSWSRGGAIAALLKREVPNGRLLVLSPDGFPVHPALNYAGARSTLRTMNRRLLQGVYRDCPASGARCREAREMPPAESFIWRSVAEDFARPPRLRSWSPAALAFGAAAGAISTSWRIFRRIRCSRRRCDATACPPRSKATGCISGTPAGGQREASGRPAGG